MFLFEELRVEILKCKFDVYKLIKKIEFLRSYNGENWIKIK